MNTLLGDLFVQHQNDKSKDPRIVETAARHDQRLNDVLKSWNFVKHIVPGDGDCLFRCVAILVKQQVRHNPSLLASLTSLSIDVSKDTVDSIIVKLRTAVVNEWLGEHMNEYQSFLSSMKRHSSLKVVDILVEKWVI